MFDWRGIGYAYAGGFGVRVHALVISPGGA